MLLNSHHQQLLQRSGSTNGGGVDGGELPFFNGLCVRVDQTIVPATMSQIIWQITQSCMALADYKVKQRRMNMRIIVGWLVDGFSIYEEVWVIISSSNAFVSFFIQRKLQHTLTNKKK